jgi:phospho-N-acetylmuramoyl-pentapeptide-transferase
MLFDLFNYLDQIDLPGAGVFKYITFRSISAFVFSLIISTLIGGKIINKLRFLQIGETIRDLGVEGQKDKTNTPTMGGIIIIIAIVIPVLLFARLNNIYLIIMLITTLWLGIVGFTDDYIKVMRKDKKGLRGRDKIMAQAGLGLIIGLILFLSPDVVVHENMEIRNEVANVIEDVQIHAYHTKSAITTIPFIKNNNFDYAWLVGWAGNYKTVATCILFIIVVTFLVTAVSNGSNLTDGLDGLAAGSSTIIGVALGILAYTSSHIRFASFLNIMFIPGAEELVVFAAAFIGATVGFLWWNAYPAQVFMGDTGSLTLGGIIAVFAILIRKELLIPLLCGIFLAESLSVIFQVAYFKRTKKKYGEGRRIFKMTPLHHHFQKKGNDGIMALIQKPLNAVPESKIVVRFWLIGIILAALTIITLKVR